MKSISRIVAFCVTTFLCTSCVMDGEVTGFGLFCIIVIGVFILGIIITMANDADKEKKGKEKRIQYQQKLTEERERQAVLDKLQQEHYEEENATLITEKGLPDKTIAIEPYRLDKEIRAYSAAKIVTILGRDYRFSDILSCTFTDDPRVEKGKTTITSTGTTKTDNGNMLGRAIVGGVVAGGAGAVIGGMTSKKNTETTSVVQQGDDIVHHNYTVLISVKDIANPLIRIPLGKQGAIVNDIVALMNAIIANR